MYLGSRLTLGALRLLMSNVTYSIYVSIPEQDRPGYNSELFRQCFKAFDLTYRFAIGRVADMSLN